MNNRTHITGRNLTFSTTITLDIRALKNDKYYQASIQLVPHRNKQELEFGKKKNKQKKQCFNQLL